MSREAPAFTLHGARWWTAPGADVREAARVVERALAAARSGEAPNTKTGRRKALHRIPHGGPGDAPDHLLKSTLYPARSALSRLFRPSKSRHELRLATALAGRGLPTPVPLAAGEERRAGRLVRCWLLVPVLPDVSDLLALARADALHGRDRRLVASGLGRLARQAFDAGLFQDDFAPNNVLVGPAPSRALWLIDFERARLRRGPVSAAERRWMLAKLERALPEARDVDRLRFLHGYTGSDRAAARTAWAEVAEEAVRLARRDLRRMLRTATHAGRRFRPVALGGWRGFARRETSDALLAALAEPAPGPAAAGGARVVSLGPSACALERRGIGARAARAAWSRGVALALRGLAAPPSALLHRGDLARLRFEHGLTAREAWRRPAAARALRRLLVRLLALGELAPEAGLASFALDGPVEAPRAVLLDPHVFRLPRFAPGRRAAAARRAGDVAARLLAEARNASGRAGGDAVPA